ncbi:bifunctional diguanylate cyclase/phosphodiesterase [Cupriavidus sp. TMH.W2]|uniref:bifunctional diguanylate cyclase/phosphodiesterase n=1 Tax=Cupriavidus sp. TMH.W2 TaxID=3434465 RepID=UPI003D78A4AB
MPLVYVGVVITTLVCGSVAYEIHDARQQAMDDVQRDLKVLSSASASQVKSFMDSVSDVLTSAAQISAPVLEAGSSRADNSLTQLRAVQTGTPVSALIVVGRAGVPVLHTYADPVPASFLAGQLATKELQVAAHDKTILLGPLRSDIDGGVWVFAARRISSQSGQFLGAVLTPLNIATMAFVGQEAIKKKGVVVAVIGIESGALLARFPDPGALRYLKTYSDDKVTIEASSRKSGVISAISAVDGVKRLMVFDRVGDYPITTITAMDESDISARWHIDALRISLIGYLSLTVVVLLLVIIHRQLRQLATRTEDVAESEQRFDRVIQQLTDGLYVRDKNGLILVANKQFARFFGVSSERELVGSHISDLNPHASAELLMQLNDEVLSARGKPYTIELETQCPNGSAIPIEYTLSAVEISGEQFILGQMRDISARRIYENQLVKQATFDEITGLPNRRVYIDRLSNALHRSKRDGVNSAVMFVDLDHFKRVNDTLGHPVGDQLLIAASRRLSALILEGDTVARFGGDEFVLLLPEFKSPLECRVLAERVVEAFRVPFELAGRSISVTASVGVAVSPEDGTEADVLLQHADTAMYEAKSGGRNDFCFFNQEMNARVHEMLQIDEEIRLALARSEISVVYQPIIDPQSGKVVKAEALARWFSRKLGQVPPDKFIPAAEENGLITQIGDWVLHEACKNAAAWARELRQPITVSVNVSAKQFDDPTFVDSVFAALEASSLPAHLLELEITERILISEDETSLETISALREIGVGLSLDDFGTGYSSLSYLTKFPLNTIKIDRAFVRDLDHDEQTQNLTRAIIALAKSLDLKLVAEGVETREQADKLILFGCEYLQGYYFGRPMSSADLLALGNM